MATQSDIDTKMALAVTANEAANWSDALKWARSALALAASLPSQMGRSGRTIEWTPESIRGFMAEIRTARTEAEVASAGGIRTTDIEYVNEET